MPFFDADDLKKVLGEVFSETMKKELFENHFRVQGKSIRYFPIEDAVAAIEKPENEGGMNEGERLWYGEPVMAHSEKIRIDAHEKKVQAENRARLGPTMKDMEKDPLAYEKWQKSENARLAKK